MNKNKGFARLKGAAAVGSVAISGLLGVANTARANTVLTASNGGLGSVHEVWQQYNDVKAGGGDFIVTAQWGDLRHGTIFSDGNCGTSTCENGPFALNTNLGRSISTDVVGWALHAQSHKFDIQSNANYEKTNYQYSVGPALWMMLDGKIFTNPDNTIDVSSNDTIVDTHNDFLADIDASVEYKFFAPIEGGPLVRASYIFTNTSLTEKSVEVLVGVGGHGNVNQFEQTTNYRTSNGDAILDDADEWVMFNNGKAQPSGLILSSHDVEANVIPFLAYEGAGKNNMIVKGYPLSIASGETQRIVVFMQMSTKINRSINDVPVFSNSDGVAEAGLLAGMTDSDVISIANYDYADGNGNGKADRLESYTPNPKIEAGSTSWPMLAILAGLYAWLFRKSKVV